MPTHADKYRGAATEFTWWLASPFLGVLVWAWHRIIAAPRWLYRRAVELCGDLTRPAPPGESARADRWLLVGLAVVALTWLALLVVAQ